jgi:hypothetical protein
MGSTRDVVPVQAQKISNALGLSTDSIKSSLQSIEENVVKSLINTLSNPPPPPPPPSSPIVHQVALNFAYLGGLLNFAAFIFILVRGIWLGRKLSNQLKAILSILGLRIVLYFISYAFKTPGLEMSGWINVGFLSFEIMLGGWHVTRMANVQKSKRNVLIMVLCMTAFNNFLISQTGSEGCAIFGPIAVILIGMLTYLLLQLASHQEFGYMVEQTIPVELLGFHIMALLMLLISSIRSDQCLNKASTKTTEAMILLSDMIALTPVLLAATLKIDALQDEEEDHDSDHEVLL